MRLLAAIPRTPVQRSVKTPVVLIAMISAGCATAPPRQSALITSTGNIEMPTQELRLRVYGYAELFTGDVEEAADRIISATDDPEIARQALRWKISITTSAQVAAFALDPLIGLYDLWVLAFQMREFFESGAGTDVFGEYQPIAVETSRELARKIEELATSVSVSGDISGARREVEKYVAAHPVTGLHFVRETVTAEFAQVLGREQTGGLAVLGDLSVQVADLSERIKFYAASLPYVFRWQSELLLLDILDDEEIDDFLDDVASVNESALRLADFADSVPPLIDRQVTELVRALNAEVGASLRDVDRQRVETLDAFRAERIAVMDQLVEERMAVMDQLAAIMDSTLRRAPEAADEVVNHAFYRALQLLLVLFGGGLLFAYLVRLMWRGQKA